MNVKNKLNIILYFIISIFLLSCSKKANNSIVIFASDSLKSPLSDIVNNYESETGKKVELSFNSSGKLAEKIESEFYTDLYISSSTKEIDKLKDKNLLYNDTIKNILKNKIVLIIRKNSGKDISSFLDLANNSIRQIAVGESMTSPIGYYTEEILHDLGIYNLVADKIIYAKSTREIVDLVEKVDNIVDCGIVYKTSAMHNNNIEIVDEDDTEVIYGITVTKNSSKKQEAIDFINYLYSEKSITVLTYYGFNVIK
ncbi:molybdate ABC transporter substrate-binding protein [uncultured Brachyspira sp.]|uniref:molybdate ABC transporter substrate-binding protein n=1 Tax=uncultured Brachyspira sp. TaxID=221953 RepID=UPI00260AF314|nr:molybdate ABC transporter substrate-binding protein [uncultured Brachyspira sp.]